MQSYKSFDRLLDDWKIKAVIFDLDGTLIDNNGFHLQAWREYLKQIGKAMTDEEYKIHLNGRTWRDAMEYIYGRRLPDEEAMQYYLEKARIYREIYAPFIVPVTGLVELLQFLQSRSIPMAIATSGIDINIDFMFEHVAIRQYFTLIVNSSHVSKGKPDPEIYLKTASLLGVHPENCLVFEDALVGIHAAKAAHMKVTGITTTHPASELAEADHIIADYHAIA